MALDKSDTASNEENADLHTCVCVEAKYCRGDYDMCQYFYESMDLQCLFELSIHISKLEHMLTNNRWGNAADCGKFLYYNFLQQFK